MTDSTIQAVAQTEIDRSVHEALAEDVGPGDITAELIDPAETGTSTLTTREDMCLCGTAWFDAVFTQLDARVQIAWSFADGDWVETDSALCTVEGPARALLTGERCAVNFVQLLSGTATTVRHFARLLEHSPTRLLDTRKTIPGHRLAQKYAVRCGGGHNHRLGLYDRFLVKENHIAAAGGIAAAIARARAVAPAAPIEVEVETLADLAEAMAHGAEVIMLDNFNDAQIVEAVRLNAAVGPRRARLEVSGGIDEDRLRHLALMGVDDVSVGALTKHVRAIDLSMRYVADPVTP